MLFYQLQPSEFTPTSGTWSATTHKFSGALLRHVYIRPTTASTTFDFQLTDEEGRVFIDMDDNTGCLNREYQIPLIGTYTISITNASVDELFDIRFVAEDGL